VDIRRNGDVGTPGLSWTDTVFTSGRTLLSETAFHNVIALERKRTERSCKPFLLMLLGNMSSNGNGKLIGRILSALSFSIRETDLTGWYQNDSVLGVIFTEITVEDLKFDGGILISRIRGALHSKLTSHEVNQITISFHIFPDGASSGDSQPPGAHLLYPDLTYRKDAKKVDRLIKRVMDVVGSALAIILLSPLFLAVAAVIKMSSPGPVLFRQSRSGQYGKPFVFLKFRSMYVGCDSTLHQQYVKSLIAGSQQRHADRVGGEGVYKLTADPRITPIGAFLRRTSLDELPQFFNVLKGEMSLVGPRPAVPYEVEAYAIWHRRRLWEAKPGMTGLWQVTGRSQVKFDDMVRLDLRYARTWSPWMDVKILLRTPAAVVFGDGAY
jgi:lipopolysaccharide/colanic/teichoic acid biosynthesis glycosyltransferase